MVVQTKTPRQSHGGLAPVKVRQRTKLYHHPRNKELSTFCTCTCTSGFELIIAVLLQRNMQHYEVDGVPASVIMPMKTGTPIVKFGKGKTNKVSFRLDIRHDAPSPDAQVLAPICRFFSSCFPVANLPCSPHHRYESTRGSALFKLCSPTPQVLLKKKLATLLSSSTDAQLQTVVQRKQKVVGLQRLLVVQLGMSSLC